MCCPSILWGKCRTQLANPWGKCLIGQSKVQLASRMARVKRGQRTAWRGNRNLWQRSASRLSIGFFTISKAKHCGLADRYQP